jgi:hypothetical protein
MKEFIALAYVNFYNDVTDETDTECIVLTEVENYSDAMNRIEAFYSQDLESVELTLLEGPFLTISHNTFEKIMEGNSI